VDVLGFDIGGTRLKAGRVDPAGQILALRSTATPETLAGLIEAVAELTEELHPGHGTISVGAGCRGIVDPVTSKVEALPGPASFLEGTLLCDLFPRAAEFAADNDARVAMAGEMAWGAARGCRHALMLTLGTGVGGAVLTGGRLAHGAGNVAGHLGHVTVDPDGPRCICGNRGCLETYFSARAIEAEAFAAAHRGCETVLRTRLGQSGRLTCEEVFAAAAAGDAVASEIVERAIRVLGGAIAGLVHAFDPEVVILGGQISLAGDILFEGVRREVWARTRRLLRREVPVVPSQVEDPYTALRRDVRSSQALSQVRLV
jgi:glucokinase